MRLIRTLGSIGTDHNSFAEHAQVDILFLTVPGEKRAHGHSSS